MTLFIYNDNVLYSDDRKIKCNVKGQLLAPAIESKVIVTDHHYIATSGFPEDPQKYIYTVQTMDLVALLMALVDSTIGQHKLENQPVVLKLYELLQEARWMVSRCEYLGFRSFVSMSSSSVMQRDDGPILRHGLGTIVIHGAGDTCAEIMLANGAPIADVYAQCRRAGIPVGETVHEHRRDDLKLLGTLYKDYEHVVTLFEVMGHCSSEEPEKVTDAMFVCGAIYEIIQMYRKKRKKQTARFLQKIANAAQNLESGAYRKIPEYKTLAATHKAIVSGNPI